MNITERIITLGLVSILAACGVGVRPGPDDGGVIDAQVPDGGRTCQSSADCRPGEECMIREGCAVPSFCGPALGRPCTGDSVPYCGCDGNTFMASSSCPTRTYAFRGPCGGVDAGAPGCRLPDGTICATGANCPAGDGCNTCVCGPNGALSCTERACIDAGPAPDVTPTPRSCRTGRDCPSGLCDGPPGCGVPWRCVEARPCTGDVTPFCGCDGMTFLGSSSCPGQPFRARGPCTGSDGGAPSCAPQDATGDGLCDAFFGFAWNGRTCVSVSGCRCVGADCGSLARDPMGCFARYGSCPRSGG
jgi:hypothetical protein